MPIYNEECFLCESLDSFFSQSINADCELICIDDGSDDSSLSILENYRQLHADNMVLVRQENMGAASARNNGIQMARGKYIGFLDADDLYPSAYTLEHLYDAASKSGLSIAGGSLVIFSHEVENSQFAGIEGFSGHQFLSEEEIQYENYQFDYGYQRFIYLKSMLDNKEIRFKNYLRYEDPIFFVESMIAAGSFYAIPEPTYKYRTAYKHVIWDRRKATDMIKGLLDVGILAAKNNYENLMSLTLLRINVDWRDVFRELIINEGDTEVLRCLLDARQTILLQPSSLDLKAMLENTPSVLEDVSNAFMELRSLHEESVRWHGEIVRLDAELHTAQEQLFKFQEDNENLRIWNDEILRSTTWKVGRFATLIPRFIKRKFFELSK